MPTISGSVYYDPNRNLNAGGATGLSDIPVALQNIVSLNRLVVITDVFGGYGFVNVPAGTYRIIQAYGTPGVPTVGDFNLATVEAEPAAQLPPLSVIPTPPIGATNLDCVSPSTIIVNVGVDDIANQNFFDGPVRYTPLSVELDTCAYVYPDNLIMSADGGTFGAFPAGTEANTGTAINPYPAISPDFTYVVPDPSKYTPIDGEFTIQNNMNNAMSNAIGAWWRISDHTTGDETGRMMVVNEDDPGGIIFRTVTSVYENTTYLFSAWILNLFRAVGYPGPEFAVRILDQEGLPLYEAALGAEIPPNVLMPEWKQIGGVINSGENAQLTIEFFSQGEAAIGNDFVLDDIALNEIVLPEFELIKSEDQTQVEVGQTVTYTVTLENACSQPLTNVRFQDSVPSGLEFVPESVIINGMSDPSADPFAGFFVPDIMGNTALTVIFQALVISVPDPNPAINTAFLQYVYTPIPGGISDMYTVESNEVALLVEAVAVNADIAVTKRANRESARVGDVITYTVTVTNFGPDTAMDVLLTDRLADSLTDVEYSFNGVDWSRWNDVYNVGTLSPGASVTLQLRAIVEENTERIVTNTAYVTSATPDDNPDNNVGRAVVVIERERKCRCRCGCLPCRCGGKM